MSPLPAPPVTNQSYDNLTETSTSFEATTKEKSELLSSFVILVHVQTGNLPEGVLPNVDRTAGIPRSEGGLPQTGDVNRLTVHSLDDVPCQAQVFTSGSLLRRDRQCGTRWQRLRGRRTGFADNVAPKREEQTLKHGSNELLAWTSGKYSLLFLRNGLPSSLPGMGFLSVAQEPRLFWVLLCGRSAGLVTRMLPRCGQESEVRPSASVYHRRFSPGKYGKKSGGSGDRVLGGATRRDA